MAFTMDGTLRRKVAADLRSCSERFERLLDESKPDGELDSAYNMVFGQSRFFDEETYGRVLRARSAIDRLACTDKVVSDLLAVAVLASLVPSSLLIRAGDVRFKTEEEHKRNHNDFVTVVRDKLLLISNDLEHLHSFTEQPVLVCEDARSLDSLPMLDIHAVVTSPPYLNGTNYFRNTKVELWFLRCLKSAEDLATFRRKAVTAGINDVSAAKDCSISVEAIQGLLNELEQKAYDPRIPRMVASYFADMDCIFSALTKHLAHDAVIVIDIGDSSYGGVHVPTDRLLAQLLISKGFNLIHEVPLRRRLSRSGFPLRQVLLAFRRQRTHVSAVCEAITHPGAIWRPAWERFKRELPHQHGDLAKRNWGHPLHSLCSYQGKMKPSLASQLVETFCPPGGTLLDPFAGAGTIPFEAALHGAKAFGFEISPAALVIAAAKLGRPDPKACESLMDRLTIFLEHGRITEDEMAQARDIHFNGPLPEYFEERTLREVLLARRFFLQHPAGTPSEALVLASLLHILHGNRPYALSRRSHPITPFAPTGETEYRPLLPRLKAKVRRSLAVSYPDGFVEGEMFFQDATVWWPRKVNQLDVIITSPPFFDSTRFYLANWMRLWFCGWEAPDFRTQPLAFVDERQKTSFSVYQPIFRQARERLKPGGLMIMHLGKSRKCNMAQELARVAAPWFQVMDVFSENVAHCESHGISDKGTVEEHQYLVLQ